MNKAIIIESVKDQVAVNRQKSLNFSQHLNSWKYSIVYSIETKDFKNLHAQVIKSTLSRAAWFEEPIPLESIEEPLYNRLKNSIDYFHPDIILLITGFVFKQYYREFFDILNRLRIENPNLYFGSFGVNNTELLKLAPKNLFDDSEKVKNIENLFNKTCFKKKRLNFF